MDQLLEKIDFCISCLTELSPSIQRCMEHSDEELISLPAIPDLSLELPRQDPETTKRMKILEKRYPNAAGELLERLYKAKTRRDAQQVPTNFGVCTFDDCWARYRVFEPARWAHHEFSQHRFNRLWTCHICQRVDVAESAWLQHLSAAHSLDLKESDTSLASQIACHVHSRPVEQEKCHFCGDCPASSREDFEKHVSAHFQDACECIDTHDVSLERMEARSPMEGTNTQKSSSDPFLGLSMFSRPPPPFSVYSAREPISLPLKLPPLNAVEFKCGNCEERPVMTLKHETQCCICDSKYDGYSTYYDRRGREIKL